ncbi:M23 family metallopeptidase [Neobacillus niacini]|uniref:M23 family metallopeptidase n=1 Tax=Neobacillus niacini TaxID=86668 RepID=UPI003000191E
MKFKLSSAYGVLEEVREGPHTGIDLSVQEGTILRSIVDGEVTNVFDGSGNIGEGVKILGEDKREYIYGHMSDVDVKVGDKVNFGDVLGESGNTGNSTAPHLHFGVKENGEFVDPSILAPKLESITGDIGIDKTVPWYDVEGRAELAIESAKENMKEEFKEMIFEFLKAVRDLVIDLADAFVLLGGGVFIILGAWKLKKANRWVSILFVSRILIKALLGGYIG